MCAHKCLDLTAPEARHIPAYVSLGLIEDGICPGTHKDYKAKLDPGKSLQ